MVAETLLRPDAVVTTPQSVICSEVLPLFWKQMGSQIGLKFKNIFEIIEI